jgi:hypothetical protein
MCDRRKKPSGAYFRKVKEEKESKFKTEIAKNTKIESFFKNIKLENTTPKGTSTFPPPLTALVNIVY